MYKCRECQRDTVGIMIQNADDGETLYVPNLCQGCMWNLKDEAEQVGKPDLTCKDCSAPCHMTVSARCYDCHVSLLDLIDSMPECEIIDPPLGYHLLGCDDIGAELEVSHAYKQTPHKNDLEN